MMVSGAIVEGVLMALVDGTTVEGVTDGGMERWLKESLRQLVSGAIVEGVLMALVYGTTVEGVTDDNS
jgi:hypothetical protein